MSKGNLLWQLFLQNIHRVAMFVVGSSIAMHETVLSDVERPFLLGLAGGLMGLPFMLSADKRFGQKGGEP